MQADKSLLFVKNKKQDHKPCFDVVRAKGLASLEPPDKQWVSTVYPKGKFAKANFLLILLRSTTKDFVQIPSLSLT